MDIRKPKRGLRTQVVRVLMVTLFVAIIGYTAVTISNHGWILVPVFSGGLA